MIRRAQQTGDRAQALLDRAEKLAERARAFNPAPPVAQPGASLAEIEAALGMLAQSGIEAVTNQLEAWEHPFDGIVESINKLKANVDGLPETLQERSIAKLQEIAEEVAEQIGEQITSVRETFDHQD